MQANEAWQRKKAKECHYAHLEVETSLAHHSNHSLSHEDALGVHY